MDLSISDWCRLVKFIRQTPDEEIKLLMSNPEKYSGFLEFKLRLRAIGMSDEWVNKYAFEFWRYPDARKGFCGLLIVFGPTKLKEMVNDF